MTLRRNYIAGEWADGVGTAQNINTSDTRDVVGTYARAGHAAAEQAIAGAFDALSVWSASTPQDARARRPFHAVLLAPEVRAGGAGPLNAGLK